MSQPLVGRSDDHTPVDPPELARRINRLFDVMHKRAAPPMSTFAAAKPSPPVEPFTSAPAPWNGSAQTAELPPATLSSPRSPNSSVFPRATSPTSPPAIRSMLS